METPNDILQGIAFHVYHGRFSNFLRAFADAYLLADKDTREILNPAWKKLIDKYLLKNNDRLGRE